MKEWLVVAGPASPVIASEVASKLGGRIAKVDTTEFPDGESKVSVKEDFRDQKVIIVQSLYPPADKHILQLLFIAHKLSEEGAEVNAAVPYLAYARQDKSFLAGEVVSLGVISHLMRSVGVKRVVTIDIHSAQGLGLFSIPIYSSSAVPLLAEYVSHAFKLVDPIAIAPDLGASTRVEAFASTLKSEYVSFRKVRDLVTGKIVTEEKDLDMKGRDAVIVDDMISTGGSVAKCAELLKKYGAKRIIVCCTHGLFVGSALERMKKAGVDEIVSSNSIPTKYSKVDVSGLISSYFQTL